jgi:hypothetical protein
MLLVRRRNIARSLEQYPSRVALTESSPQSKFEIFKALDRFGSKRRGGSRVFEDVRIGQLTKPFDRAIQLGGRDPLLGHVATQRLGVVQPLLGFATELLRVFGRQTAAGLRATARCPTAVRRTTVSQLLSIATALALGLAVGWRLLLTLPAALPLLALLSLSLLALLSLALLSLLSLALLALLAFPLPLLRLLLSLLSATLLALATALVLLPGLPLLALLIAALGESALRTIRTLFLTLAHALVHRLEAAHEIARAIRGLCLLPLSAPGLRRGLCLL